MRPASSIFWLAIGLLLSLQGPAQSPHFDQHGQFFLPRATMEEDYDREYDFTAAPPLPQTNDHFMRRTVYGFHPGWCGTSYRSFDYGIVPTVAYYGYIVDPATGGSRTSYFWKESPVVGMAHAKGSAVELVVATGSAADNRRLLQNPTAVANLVDSLVHFLALRDADGLCLDFEDLPGDQAEGFTAFVHQLRDSMDVHRKKAGITITLPHRDPGNAFDLGALRKSADRFIVKSYAAAGSPPVAVSAYESALIHYQRKGLPKQQTVLALPLWTGEGESLQPYRLYQGKGDSTAIAGRPSVANLEPLLDLATNRNIQGVALWAMGYDHGLDEVHDLLKEKYSQSETESFGESAAKEDLGFLGPDGGATRERNANNWMWMLGGCVFFVLLLLALRKWMK